MNRKQILFYALFNAALLSCIFIFKDELAIVLFVGVVSNVFIVYRLELVHQLENQKRVSQAKQLNLQQEKNIQLKSRQIETIVSNLPFPIALMNTHRNIVLSNILFDQFVIDHNQSLSYDSKAFQQDIGSFIKHAYIKDEAQTKTFNINGIDFQALSIPVFDGGRSSGCLFMFLDITKILEGERVQKRFIADASHELRTPLSVITGMIRILNRPDFKDTETLKEFVDQIDKESLRMDNIITDLMVLSKLSSNRVILNPELVNLKQLILDVYTPLKRSILEKNNTFTLEIDEKIHLNLDRVKAHQIFTNLLTNAIKFTQDGTITISSEISAPFCIIKVIDTGIGIKEEDQKYIFERFYRTDQSRSRASGGSGLGLAIVKSFVIAHKGEIEVSSTVEKGSCFTVKLPL
ncbi:MAG: two-component system sensor histidine kinase phosphate regulon sensor PhoR [Erysipelotrichaceae bacterium]|nr:MAG: two-component system sensor histidine kinase phosphate regulon sensor PhoR [Erysipelotrichaceae bacterium]